MTAYFAFLYIALVIILGSFAHSMPMTEPGTLLFTIMGMVSYALLYMLPAILLSLGFLIILAPAKRPAGWKSPVLYTIVCLSGSSVLLFLCADRYLFSLYGYHFNAFVWNLVTTPGGIDSLGSTEQTQLSAALVAFLLVVFNAVLIWALQRRRLVTFRRSAVIGVLLLLAATLVVEEGGYAYARYINDEPVLMAASIIPLHLNSSATKLFKAAGIERPPIQERVRISQGTINYPLKSLQVQPLNKYLNIVWLTAESFRWDLLTPEITPNLWQFSERAVRFNQHYSGGNRTRMGMFSMFYGLFGSYWYGFENQRIQPVLMQFIADHNYQMAIHTSQSFSYPELDHTVFVQVPAAHLQELQSGPSWQRDHQNISDISQFIANRDPDRPFFTFMFFESTHAPYNFPASAVIRDDYLQEVNYLELNNLAGNIEQLHNRYINAAHHIDTEVGRVLQRLEEQGLLDETIVLFTGDHGEEFMEEGHWGHGHNKVFPEMQIRVPLVLWMPGTKPRQIDYPTSHVQLPATLLPVLGVTSAQEDYSSAQGLFAGPPPYRVVGNYDYLAVIDAESKISFPYTSADYFHYGVTDGQDHLLPLVEQRKVLAEHRPRLSEVEAECNRFIEKQDVTHHGPAAPTLL